MTTIDINEALNILRDAAFEKGNFSIRFLTMEGEERFYERAKHGAPEQPFKKAALTIDTTEGVAKRGKRVVSLMRDNGTIPITNLSTKEFKTPKWFGLLEVDGKLIR